MQLRDEMCGGALVIECRRIVVQNAEIRACFEPEIIRFAGMISRRRVVLRGIAGDRQQRAVDIRRARIANNVRPTFVLHQNDEHGAVRVQAGESHAAACEQEQQ